MPTPVNGKAAEIAAARARAKAWRDGRRSGTPQTTNAQGQGGASKPKSSSKQTPPRSGSKAKKAASANAKAGPNAVQYRKTPSRQERAEARAKARAWSESRNKSTPGKKKRVSLGGVPSVIGGDESVEEMSAIEEDFQTAVATEVKTDAQTQAGAASLAKGDLKELQWMVNDLGTNYARMKHFLEKQSEAANDDLMDLD